MSFIKNYFIFLLSFYSYLLAIVFFDYEPRNFQLLNNIDFGDTGLNLTEIVSNIQNNRVSIIKTHFPYMNKINDSTYEPMYGGIPLLVNYTDFMITIQDNIKANNFTDLYDGLIVFDMENWTPIWETLSEIYQNMTINYTLDLYPELRNNWDLLNERSKQLWNTQSMELMLEAIDIAREICPLSKIGYYGYPGMPYWGNNIDFEIARNHNDELFALWNNVDILLPSIYIPYISTHKFGVFENNFHYVERKINEALRIKKIMNLTDLLIMPYTWHRYHDPYDKNFLVNGDLYLEYKLPHMYKDIDGIVLWSTENNEERMEDTKSWFENNSKFLEKLL